MVIFDAQDKAIWFQSINFKVILEKGNLVFYGLKNENGEWVSDTVSYNIQNNIDVRKITLYAEYKADQEYFLRIGYQDANKHLNSELVLSGASFDKSTFPSTKIVRKLYSAYESSSSCTT